MGWCKYGQEMCRDLSRVGPYEVAKATIPLERILNQPIGKTALIVAFEIFVGIPIMIIRVRCVVGRMTGHLSLSDFKY